MSVKISRSNGKSSSLDAGLGFTPSPKDVALIAVSNDTDLTRSLILVLRRIIVSDQGNALLILSSLPVSQLLERASDFQFDPARYVENGQLVIVDCISRMSDQKEISQSRNLIYAQSPADLAEIALRVAQGMTFLKQKGERWLILDSITTLSLYNSTGGIVRFMQYLLSKLKILDFDGVMIVVRDEISDSMIQSLKQYCNKVIFLSPIQS
jgi:archaellum biogenesis ATPase FlaH